MKRTIHVFLVLAAFCWPFVALSQQFVPVVPGIQGQTVIASGINGGPTTTSGDRFGTSTADIGDLNNDGVDDIAVGAYMDDNGGANTDAGAIYICFLNTSKTVTSSVKIGKSVIGSDIASNDLFGSSVAGIGDLNGDGYEDVAVGAYGNDGGITNGGAVFILFLDSAANVLSHTRIYSGSTSGGPTLTTNAWMGHGLTNLGDIDGDHVTDLMVGSPRYTPSGGNEEGAVWVFLMNTNGTVKQYKKITKSTSGFGSLSATDNFGTAVAATGDLNGDGIPDAIAGAWQDDTYAANAGCFYLLYLTDSGTVASYKKYTQPFVNNINYTNSATTLGRSLSCGDLDNDNHAEFIVGLHVPGNILIMATDSSENILSVKKITSNKNWATGLPNGAGNFGISSACLFDIDGDKKIEYVVGTAGYDAASQTDNGGIYIFDLDSTEYTSTIVDIIDTEAYGELSNSIADFANGDDFGISVCSPGDVNGDGYNDLAVGAYLDNDGATDKGALYIIFLDSIGQKTSVQKISDLAGSFGTGLDATDQFGISVCAPGDLDGDTIPDIIVGANQDDDGGSNRGAIWVIYLNSNGTVKSKHKISSTMGGFAGTLSNTCSFGYSLAAIGDIDNDGIDDIAVGAYLDDDGGTDHGAVWILFMNAADSVKSYQKISDTQGNFTETFSGTGVHFGMSVASAGDLDGDGKEDLLVGAPSMDGTGAAYILYLDTLGKVSSYKKINNTASNFPYTLTSGELFGRSMLLINDLNGDSIQEIAIGQSNHPTYGSTKGAIWIAFPDSTGNIYDARSLEEGQCLFYGPLGNDNMGFALGNYVNASNEYYLLAGLPNHNENGSAEGGVFRMGLLDISASLTIMPKMNNKYYVNTRKEIDGGYYLTNNGKLNVRYEGEYDSSYPLKFKVYNQNYDVVATDAVTGILGAASTQSFGENFYTFNFAVASLTYNQYYILEITNQKKEKEFLRFKYLPFIVTGTPK